MKKQKLTGKGMTIVSEALLSVGIILVAVAFVFVGGSIVNFQSGGLFSSAQNQMTNEIGSVIRSLPDSSGSFSSTYEAEVASYTLTVQENSVVSVEIPGQSTSSSSFAGLRLENTRISDSEALCISKRGSNVSITAGGCDDSSMSNFCANGRCINGECQVDKGETCANAGGDCTCGSDSACETGYKAEDYIDASGSGDDELDTNEKGCVLPRFVGSQDSEGDQCDYNFECGGGLSCSSPHPNAPAGVTQNRCCPSGEAWDGSQCKVATKVKLLFVPMESKPANYDTAVQSHADAFKNTFPLKSCKDLVEVEKLSSTCDTSISFPNCQANALAALSDLESCASGHDYDFVIGLFPDGSCSGVLGWSDGQGGTKAVAAEAGAKYTTPHEIGHEYGLNDEYMAVSRCSGPYTPGTNKLEEAYSGDTPTGGYSSDYCAGGSQCPGSYPTVTCMGNEAPSGGRDLMGQGDTFAPPSYNHLKTIPQLQCP